MKQLTTLLIFLSSLSFSYAQEELSLHFLQGIQQSNLTNPAFIPSQKTTLLLPSYYYNLHTPDFTLKSLFALNSSGVRDINEIVQTTVGIRNRMTTNLNVATFGYTYMATPKLHISINHSYHANIFANVDGVLLKALVNDYDKNIGHPIPFSSTINGDIYHQLAIGGAYQYQENIHFGIRFKILKGISSVFTRSGESLVTITDYNYATSYMNHIDLLSYSLDKVKQLKTINGLLKQSFNGQNLGIGLDLGFSYTVSKWQFSASLIDALSIIGWNKDGKNYIGTGFHNFSGIGIANLFQSGKLSFKIQDTLKNIIGLTVLDNKKYTQKLPTKTYISALYKLNHKLQLGALIYDERGGNTNPKTDLMLDISYKITKNIDIGSNWSIRNQRFDNFGVHATAQYKGIQLYGLTDNILSVFNPYNFKSANGRIGVNIILQSFNPTASTPHLP